MATICVGVTSSGDASGSDWSNQAALPTDVTWVRGNTYYIADGVYGALELNVASSGTTLITIKKAIESSHGPSTGWSSAFGDGTAVFTIMVISKDYVVIDGQTGGGPGSWTSGFGFTVDTSFQDVTNANPAVYLGAHTQNATNHVTVRHVHVIGDGGEGGTPVPGAYGNDAISTWGGTDNTYEYMYMHDMGRCIILAIGDDNLTFQYNCTGPFEYTAGEHSEVAAVHGDNQVFRYNLFLQVGGTGGLMFDGTGNQVYGNIFYNIDNTLGSYSPGGNGCIGAMDSGQTVQNTLIYNNTYINQGTSVPFIGFYMGNFAGNTAYNNLLYGTGADPGDLDSITNDFNYFVDITGPGAGNDATGTGNPFVTLDITSPNFAKLTSPTAAGTALASPYDVDILGITRGSDGTWDRGAMEFIEAAGSAMVITGAPTY